MEDFLRRIKSKGYKNRTIAIIENGSWAPSAARTIKAILEGMQVDIIEDVITIKSRMSNENVEEMKALAEKLVKA